MKQLSTQSVKFFRFSIQPDALIFDLTVGFILYLSFFYYKENFLSPFLLFTPESGYIILSLIAASVMLNLGMLMRRYKAGREKKKGMILIQILFWIIALSHLLVLFAQLIAMDAESLMLLLSFMPQLIIISAMSFLAGESIADGDPVYFRHLMTILVYFLLAFLPLIIIRGMLNGESFLVVAVSAGLLIFGGYKIGFSVPEFIFKKKQPLFSKLHERVSKGIPNSVVRIIFPVLLGTGMFIFQDLILSGPSQVLPKSLQLIISGILPVRFLRAVAPPLNIFNIITAAGLISLLLLL